MICDEDGDDDEPKYESEAERTTRVDGMTEKELGTLSILHVARWQPIIMPKVHEDLSLHFSIHGTKENSEANASRKNIVRSIVRRLYFFEMPHMFTKYERKLGPDANVKYSSWKDVMARDFEIIDEWNTLFLMRFPGIIRAYGDSSISVDTILDGILNVDNDWQYAPAAAIMSAATSLAAAAAATLPKDAPHPITRAVAEASLKTTMDLGEKYQKNAMKNAPPPLHGGLKWRKWTDAAGNDDDAPAPNVDQLVSNEGVYSQVSTHLYGRARICVVRLTNCRVAYICMDCSHLCCFL